VLSKLEKIQRMSELSGMQDQLARAIGQMLDQLLSSIEDPAKEKILAYAKAEAIPDLFHRHQVAFSDLVDDEFLDGMIAFYESPLGRQSIEFTKQAEAISAQVVPDWNAATMARIDAIIAEDTPTAFEQYMISNFGDNPLIRHRIKFVRQYAKEHNIDLNHITMEQIIEIRSQPGWKEAQPALA
jgi:hypothetical protein